MKKTPLRRAFVNELKTLDSQFTKMGILTCKAIEEAVDALLLHHTEVAHHVIDNDKVINELEREIDRECFRLISLQGPIGDELRFIIAIIKASSDLERMGDHAVSIARGVLKVNNEPRMKNVEADLEKMADTVIKMADAAVSAFIVRDEQRAKEIAEMDHEVDHYFSALMPIILEDMKSNPKYILTGSSYISIISNLERMGDYVTNLCERIIFLDEGKVVNLND